MATGPGSAASRAPRHREGELIAGYTITRLAGRGGMGVVYEARDPELARPVALKLISHGRAGEPAARAALVRESLLAAGLEHPHVLPIYRAGEQSGELFIAMRFVEGPSLQEMIDEGGRLDPQTATALLTQICSALDAAHERGLIHRDVKPANILIAHPESAAHAYLGDFGVAVRGNGVGPQPSGWVGTRDYVSPEQIRGRPLDRRSDVYSLGCVLYHCLTGRPPYPGDEQATLIGHLTSRAPRASDAVPQLPKRLDNVIATAMAKHATSRFASAGDFAEALESARRDSVIVYPPRARAAARALCRALEDRGLDCVTADERDPDARELVRFSRSCAHLSFTGNDPPEPLTDAMGRLRHRGATVLLPGSGPAPSTALGAVIDMRAGVQDPAQLAYLERALRGEAVPQPVPTESEKSPYRGLEPFDEGDALLFHGREAEIEELTGRLDTGPFVAILGHSGSGKSSLLRAGVIPALKATPAPGVKRWSIALMTPGRSPLESLSAALGTPGIDPSQMVRTAAGRLNEDERLLLVLDQMEELFTLVPEPRVRSRFFAALADALDDPGLRFSLVCAMRADFYDRVIEHERFAKRVSSSQMLLAPLDQQGVRRAIEMPAATHGLELESGLVSRIMADIADRPGSLPLLEYLLNELWRRRSGRTLTLEAYAASGGVEGALARRADEVFARLDGPQKIVARQLFLRLVDPGEGLEVTRRPARRDEIQVGSGEAKDLEAVVESLTEERLITSGRDQTGAASVEIAHEALIKAWPLLRGWIEDEREHLRLRRRLSDSTREWEEGGREEGNLYRGLRLESWRERSRQDLNPLEREFLESSFARADREASQRRRRLRLTIVGLGTALAVLGSLAAFALVKGSEAADQRDAALSRQLANSSQIQLTRDPELATLLAMEAWRADHTLEAENALRAAAQSSHLEAALRNLPGGAVDALYLPNGKVALAAGDGTLRFWDPSGGQVQVVHTDQRLASLEVSRNGRLLASVGGPDIKIWRADGSPVQTFHRDLADFTAAGFTPDGRRVIAGDFSRGTVFVWTIGRREPRVLPAIGASLNRHLAVSPGGDSFVSGTHAGPARERRLDGTPVRVLRTSRDAPVRGAAFSPDGAHLALALESSSLQIYDRDRHDPPIKRSGLPSSFTSIDWSPDSRFLATSDTAGTIRVWSAAGSQVVQLVGSSPIATVRFSPDGRRLLSAGDDGTVRIWTWRDSLPYAVVRSSASASIGGTMAFTSDGRGLLSVGRRGSLDRWDLQRGTVTRLRVGSSQPFFVAFSGDARRYVSSDFPSGIVVRSTDPSDPRTTTLTPERGDPAFALSLSHDGSRLASIGSVPGQVLLWDVAKGTAQTLTNGKRRLVGVALSGDASTIATVSASRRIDVWDVASRRIVNSRMAEGSLITEIHLSRDGRRVLYGGGADGAVTLWNHGSGELVGLQANAGTALIRFSESETRVLAVSQSGVQIWDATTGARVFSLPALGRNLSAVLSPANDMVVVQTLGGRLEAYACSTCGPMESALAWARTRVTRDLSADERRRLAVGG